MYSVGNYVRLNPDCSTPAEQRLIFIITDIRKDQAVIVCINPVTITPAETVTFDMIESLF